MLNITETWYFEVQTLRKVERKASQLREQATLCRLFHAKWTVLNL